MAVEVRLLERSDDRGQFESGDERLDRYLRDSAGQHQFKQHVSVTHVAIDEGVIVGYASIAACSIDGPALRTAGMNVPKMPLPALRLARLAVASKRHRTGIGEKLLECVFIAARQMAGSVGCVGVVVDAYPQAVQYYARWGFATIDVAEGAMAGTVTMFLKLDDIG